MLNNEVLDEFDLENILLWKRVAGISPELAEKMKWKEYEHHRSEISISGNHRGTLNKIELMFQKLTKIEKKEPESTYQIKMVLTKME